MHNSGLTAERLRALIDYDLSTGVMTWKADIGRAKRGESAGYLCSRFGYVMVGLDGKNYRAHRLAWLFATGDWPAGVIDHINGDKADNRLANLRDVTQRENTQNRHVVLAVSGLLGAYRAKRGKWRSSIRINGRLVNLGEFESAQDAHAAYLEQAQKRETSHA